MRVLIDTNVLLRSIETGHAQHDIARDALRDLRQSGHELVIVPQVLYEFWVVTTRPAADNGLGFSVQRASADIADLMNLYSLYHDDIAVFLAWRDLVVRYGTIGKPAHDARLAAAMVRHGITHLLSFNAHDFARYTEVTPIPPETASSFPPVSQ
jgi:predicted nucleic acid-binding protein